MRREDLVQGGFGAGRRPATARQRTGRRPSGARRLQFEQLENRRVLATGGPGQLLVPVVEVGADVTIREGSVFVRSGAFQDPDSRSWSATVDYGDGGGPQTLIPFLNKTFELRHTYADNGIFTVTVTVTGDSQLPQSDSLQVTVENVAPSLFVRGRQTVFEGPVLVTDIGLFTDPGFDNPAGGTMERLSYTIDWGDGTEPGSGAARILVPGAPGVVTRGTFDGSHTYADEGRYTAAITVKDDDGGLSVTRFVTMNVQNAPPEITQLQVEPSEAFEGDTVTLRGAFQDPSSRDTHTVQVDWGDGTIAEAAVDAATRTFSVDHRYRDNPPASPFQFTIRVMVRDNSDATATRSVPVTVHPAPPVVNAGIDQTVDEGQEVLFAGAFTDPGELDTHTLRWDFGDGATAVGTLAPKHIYADDGVYTVTLTVTDNDGSSGADALAITVRNAAPTLTVPGAQTVPEGTRLELKPIGLFSDPGFANPAAGTSETFTYSIDWGDGTPASSGVPTITQAGAPGIPTRGSFDGQHVYADDGTYTVTVRVTDDDGGAATERFPVTVTNIAPTLRVVGNQAAVVGTALALPNLGVFTDPGFTSPSAGISETFTYSIAWGDNTPADTGPASIDQVGSPGVPTSGSFDGTHTYLQAGTWAVTVRVTDDDGGFDEEQLEIVVSGPAAQGEASDLAGRLPIGPWDARVALPTGTTTPDAASSLAPTREAASDEAEPAAVAPPDPGREKSRAAQRLAAEGDMPTAEAAPPNQPPIVFGPGNVSLPEGPVTLDQWGAFFDGDSAGPFRYRIDWGDGSAPATGTATIDVAGPPAFGSFAGTHGYADDGSFTLSMSVTDEQGAVGTEVFDVAIVNVPPRLENVTITSPINEGSTATVRGTIADPGVNDTFVLVVTWGDGTTDRFNYSAGTTSFRETHRYANNRPGNDPYPVRLAVADDDEPDKPAIADVLVVVENVPPTAVDDIYAHTGDGPLLVDAAHGVLANDTDPGGDVLTAVAFGAPTAGTLEGRPDGSFIFTPPRANFSGVVRFTYQAMDSDGAISTSAASVTIDSSLRASISGTVRAILPGVRGEPLAVGIPGVTITLTEVTTQDIAKITTLSGDDGSYRFDGLRAGTYVVTETQPAALFPFGPDLHQVVLNGNDARTGVDFQEGWLRDPSVSLRNLLASSPAGLSAYTADVLRQVLAQAEARAGRADQAAAIRRGGAQTTVVIAPGAGDDAVEWVAGSTHHRVTVNGRPLIFVASAVEGFRLQGGEGRDALRLVGSPSDDIATLRPVNELSTLQLPNYALTSGISLVSAQGWEILTMEGGGGYDRAVLYDSPGDDLLEARGQAARLLLFSNNDLVREVVDFDLVRAVATAGGVDARQVNGPLDYALETEGTWIDR